MHPQLKMLLIVHFPANEVSKMETKFYCLHILGLSENKCENLSLAALQTKPVFLFAPARLINKLINIVVAKTLLFKCTLNRR